MQDVTLEQSENRNHKISINNLDDFEKNRFNQCGEMYVRIQ